MGTVGQYGVMFEVIPILAAALILGFLSGLIAVHALVTRAGRPSVWSLAGLVALAAGLSCLIVARPQSGQATIELYSLTAFVTALLDFGARCLVVPRGEVAASAPQARRHARIWCVPAIVAAILVTITVLKLRFDMPLNPDLLPRFSAELSAGLLIVWGFDLVIRLATRRLMSPWRPKAVGTAPGGSI